MYRNSLCVLVYADNTWTDTGLANRLVWHFSFLFFVPINTSLSRIACCLCSTFCLQFVFLPSQEVRKHLCMHPLEFLSRTQGFLSTKLTKKTQSRMELHWSDSLVSELKSDLHHYHLNFCFSLFHFHLQVHSRKHPFYYDLLRTQICFKILYPLVDSLSLKLYSIPNSYEGGTNPAVSNVVKFYSFSFSQFSSPW